VNAHASSSRNIEWGAWIVAAVGVLLFLLGVGRFLARYHFGWREALYCCLAVVPAGLLLLVLAYVLQHARLVSIIPLVFVGMLVFSSPVWDVALGLALLAVVLEPVVSDWRYEKHLRGAPPAHRDENAGRK
jgi:hypothetical protein